MLYIYNNETIYSVESCSHYGLMVCIVQAFWHWVRICTTLYSIVNGYKIGAEISYGMNCCHMKINLFIGVGRNEGV